MATTYRRVIPALAFIAGIALTLGFKDFYPDLERRFRRRRRDAAATNDEPHLGDKLHITEDAILAGSEDAKVLATGESQRLVLDGIDGCIGNTPLFKIKSLSEETGCEILAKAEVRAHKVTTCVHLISSVVPQWWWRQSQGSCSFKHHQAGSCNYRNLNQLY